MKKLIALLAITFYLNAHAQYNAHLTGTYILNNTHTMQVTPDSSYALRILFKDSIGAIIAVAESIDSTNYTLNYYYLHCPCASSSYWCQAIQCFDLGGTFSHNYDTIRGSWDCYGSLSGQQCNGTNTDTYIRVQAADIKQFANNNEQEITIYPNPATTIINVELKIINGIQQNATLQITDVLGNTVKQSIIYNSSSIINVSDFPEGIYNVRINSSDGVVNRKLVIVR